MDHRGVVRHLRAGVGAAVLQHRVLLRLPARRSPLDAADGDDGRADRDPADDLGRAAARAPIQSALSDRRRHRADVPRVPVVRSPARVVARVLRGMVRLHDRLPAVRSDPAPDHHLQLVSPEARPGDGHRLYRRRARRRDRQQAGAVARVVHAVPQRDPGARVVAAARVAAGAVRPEGSSRRHRPAPRRRSRCATAGPRRRRVADLCGIDTALVVLAVARRQRGIDRIDRQRQFPDEVRVRGTGLHEPGGPGSDLEHGVVRRADLPRSAAGSSSASWPTGCREKRSWSSPTRRSRWRFRCCF